MTNKTVVIYENYDPTITGVTHVAINATTAPHVFSTYRVRREDDLPILPRDIIIMPIEGARNLFDFKPGKLETTQ